MTLPDLISAILVTLGIAAIVAARVMHGRLWR